MIGTFQRRNLLVDEVEIEALLLWNEIADIIQDEFVREMNHLVYKEARSCCEGFEMDDLSQIHHYCMMQDEEEIWVCHYEQAKKKHLKLDKLWSAIEKQIHKKLDVYLEDSWLKYLLHLVKVDSTSAYLMYKNFERNQNENQDECLRLGCYEYQ